MRKMQGKIRIKSASIIGDPRFSKWVRSFDFNNPKFLAAVAERNRASEAQFSDLERETQRKDREIDWRVPIRNGRERT